MLDRKSDRRRLGQVVLAMVVAALSACTRVDLQGPGGRIVLDRRGRYRRRDPYDDRRAGDDDDDDDD